MTDQYILLAFVALMATLGCVNAAATHKSFVAALDADHDNFATISMALDNMHLTDVFQNPNLAVTIFIPTNKAFNAISASSGVNVNALPPSTIRQVLYYHITKGVHRTSELTNNEQLQTYVTGKTLGVLVSGSEVTVVAVGSTANIVSDLADLECGKGIAHGIDAVLLPAKL